MKTIKLITERDLIMGVADRFKEAMFLCWGNEIKPSWFGPGQQEKYHQLEKLNKLTASVTDVEAIIGNISWTGGTCSVCSKFGTPYVRFAENDDGDGAFNLCFACVQAAADLVKGTADRN